jgi:preprotein translocase subunit SecD
MRLLTILIGPLLSILGLTGGTPVGRHTQAAHQTTKLLLVLQAEPADGAAVTLDALNAAARTIERRAEGLGIDDPAVWTTGGDRIVVELPGVNGDDADQLTQALITTALLEIIDTQGAFLPPGTVVATTLGEPTDGATPEAETVYETIVSGSDFKEAYSTPNQLGEIVVGFDLTDEAARKFYDFTSSHVGQPMSIVIDKRVISSPVINSAISSRGIIEGFPLDDVKAIVGQLNSGALAVPVRVVTSMVLTSVPSVGAPTPTAAR